MTKIFVVKMIVNKFPIYQRKPCRKDTVVRNAKFDLICEVRGLEFCCLILVRIIVLRKNLLQEEEFLYILLGQF